MSEGTLQDQITNIEVQRKYIGLAWDFLNQMDFKGHLAGQLVETQLFLKGFYDALDKTYKDLESKLPKAAEATSVPVQGAQIVK